MPSAGSCGGWATETLTDRPGHPSGARIPPGGEGGGRAPRWRSQRGALLVPSVGQAVLASAAACYSGGVDWTFQHRVVKTLGDDGYVPDGVVNDRWQTDSLFRRVMGLRPARGSFDLFLKRVIARDPGVGTSYGYNPQETDADYAPFEQTLFPEFVAAVAKNGRLLLNVGPAGGGGQIPPEQRSRLEAFGAWLDANGEAVTGTRPHQVAGARTADGLPVWFTQAPGPGQRRRRRTADGRNGPDPGRELPAARGRLLGDGSVVTVRPSGGSTVLTFDHELDGTYAPAVAVQIGSVRR